MKYRSILTKPAMLAVASLAVAGLTAGPVGATTFSGTVYFSRVTPEIRSADPNHTNSSKVIYDGGNTKDVKASQTGGHIAFLRAYDTGNYNLWVMDTDGSNLENLTADGTINVDSFDWKNTGNVLVWSDGSHLFTVDVDGSNVTQLTNTANADTDPHYRTSGPTILVFNRNISGNNEVFTYNFVNDTATNITNNVGDDRVSASGNPWRVVSSTSRIYFQSNRSGNFDIYKVAPDGTALQQLTTSTDDQVDASVSPDIQHVAFRRNYGSGLYDIELMTKLGVYERRLTVEGDVSRYTWSPEINNEGVAFTKGSTTWDVDINRTTSRQIAEFSSVAGLDWAE